MLWWMARYPLKCSLTTLEIPAHRLFLLYLERNRKWLSVYSRYERDKIWFSEATLSPSDGAMLDAKEQYVFCPHSPVS